MQDPTLLVGRQSEGPSHPLLMRRNPPRQKSAILLSAPENIARPSTMYFFPKTQVEGIIQVEDGYYHRMNDGWTEPQNQRYRDPQPQYMEISPPEYTALPSSRDLVPPTETENDRLSRQRRVENSSDKSNLESDVVRHGRFNDLLSERGSQNDNNNERFDTFGLRISEHTWVGPKR